jgi:hypothetical protein
MRLLLVTLAVLALAGCGSTPKSSETAAGTPATTTPAAGSDAAVAAAPNLITELTDQKVVYECPKCGMMFDAAGTCSMGCAELVATQVAYSCPKDGQAVEKAGQCPRCPMNARVEKTAMAAAATQDKQ